MSLPIGQTKSMEEVDDSDAARVKSKGEIEWEKDNG